MSLLPHLGDEEGPRLSALDTDTDHEMGEIEFIPPICHLPAEILSLIFFWTLPLVDPEFFSYPVICGIAGLRESILQIGRVLPSHCPWILAQICRRWRKIALSNHTLWSWPVIAGPSFTSSPVNRQLERSGKTKLHVCVGHVGGYTQMPPTLAAICRSSERWVEAILCINWPRYNEDLVALKGRVGNLETLHVRSVWVSTAHTTFEGDSRLALFAVAPKLRSLIVVGICDVAHSFLLPWNQLTRYQNTADAVDHVRVLELCPNLVEADLTLLALIRFTADEKIRRLPVPHLRRLYVSDSAFLAYIALPALEDVVLERRDPEADTLFPLLHLTECDAPPLSSVSLRSGVLDSDTLTSVTETIPPPVSLCRIPTSLASVTTSLLEGNGALASLRLRVRSADISVFHDLLARLWAPAPHSFFAPSLKTVSFEIRGAFDDALFMDMIESRQQQGRPFERIGLALPTKFAVPFWRRHTERVAAVRRAGTYFWIDSSSAPNDVATSWRDA